MSPHDLNMLSLCDCLRKCYDDHLRYRRHLYLDRNQSYGEIELNRTSKACAKLDYMMKLRAKQWKADTSVFHLMMNKGTSVHVFCFKGRIDGERLKELKPNDDASTSMVQVGDYVMIWIDSFGSNTTQGGYETLCVEETSLRKLRKLKELCPWVEEIDFVPDAGSGYKSSQTLLGLRNIKQVTGIRVRYVHFNASGEGKRWETDGHNTDIKVQREQAMRAGKPHSCCTPASEVEAQLFGGGIEGSYPTLLEFDYSQEVAVDTWDGISVYHDFELHENGDITAWRSYQVGKGKRFEKSELDGKYKSGTSQPSLQMWESRTGHSNQN